MKEFVDHSEIQIIDSFKSKASYIYCLCCKPDDGWFYVQCEECSEWFHPDCLAKKDNLAGLFLKMEWKNITIKCPNKNTEFVYHHFAPTKKIFVY